MRLSHPDFTTYKLPYSFLLFKEAKEAAENIKHKKIYIKSRVGKRQKATKVPQLRLLY